jgi:DNA ligase (NAD+)
MVVLLQIIGRIQHFISRKAMDIEGLGGETVVYCLPMV